jgi:pyridoxamine 5'-phosphate oxidase
MPDPHVAEPRREYDSGRLEPADLTGDPLVQLQLWLGDAVASGAIEPYAMTVATAGADGRPSARTVLLRGVDTGLVFFTNRHSRKGRELAANPQAAVVLVWLLLERQVTARGRVEAIDDAASDDYFAARPRGSQLAAWLSPQSDVIADRAELEQRKSAVDARFASAPEVPRPSHWGGYRLVPDEVEFWQGRRHRLHDRLRYRHPEGGWIIERLAP